MSDNKSSTPTGIGTDAVDPDAIEYHDENNPRPHVEPEPEPESDDNEFWRLPGAGEGVYGERGG